MKYKLTKAEQETVINFDNELDTASIYTHDSRLIKKLRELRKQYPEQFILEHRTARCRPPRDTLAGMCWINSRLLRWKKAQGW